MIRMTSWRRSSPKFPSARDEIPGRCAEAKSSSGTALRRLRNCPRTRTHFDGATKPGWHANSVNDAEPFYPKSIDPAQHLLAIRHLACGFSGSVSEKLTPSSVVCGPVVRFLSTPRRANAFGVASRRAVALRGGWLAKEDQSSAFQFPPPLPWLAVALPATPKPRAKVGA